MKDFKTAEDRLNFEKPDEYINKDDILGGVGIVLVAIILLTFAVIAK